MSNFEILNLDQEFSRLVALVNELWDGCNNEAARLALRFAFEQGLKDAALWIDKFLTFRIAEVLNGHNKSGCPLNARYGFSFEGDKTASQYDALCEFDNNLSLGLSDIYESVTRFGRWSYEKQASALCHRLRVEFPSLDVSPKNQDAKSQRLIVKEYPGCHAGEAGSFSTPERLLQSYVEYSRDEQGISFFRSLFSAVYSHGLYCAKMKNTQVLVNDLLEIYSKRDEPLNFDNGGEILSAAMKNQFVAIIHEIRPFKFFSTEEYLASKKAKESITAEERIKNKARINERMKSIIANIDLDKKHMKIDMAIDVILPTVQAYRLA